MRKGKVGTSSCEYEVSNGDCATSKVCALWATELAFRVLCGKLRRVKALCASPLFRSRYILAIAAGLLLAAAFPPFGVAGFAWIAPGLMVGAALGKRGWESFRVGYVTGLTYYLTALYWLLLIPYRWHGLPLGPASGWLALSGFVGLFPAGWVWQVASSLKGGGEQAGQPDAPDGGLLAGDHGPMSTSWMRRTGWAFSGAAAWVAFEMVLARVFGGFPWDLLGVSQHHLVPLIQIASVTGVYGISFLVVWFSLAMVSAGLMVIGWSGVPACW